MSFWPFGSDKYKKLIQYNSILTVLHAIQGITILIVATDFKLPVSTEYLTFNFASQTLVNAQETLFSVQLSYLIVAFLFLSALAHLIIATAWRSGYMEDLKKGMNRARWFEYSLSASVMMVAIAMLVGIYDLSSLLMLFSLVAIMNLLGLVMEVHNQDTQKTNWLSFTLGCLAGIVPWIVVGVYFWASNAYGSGDIPTFVYWIYVSIFLFFNCFAINMYLQYRKIGPWKDYLFGEKVYMLLSLVAKSALAWQVFAGTLRP